MISKCAIRVLTLSLLVRGLAGSNNESASFTYHGFNSLSLYLDGLAKITSNGLLQLTDTTLQAMGHAFFNDPITFKNSSSNSSVYSFSTTIVFAIDSKISTLGGHGIVFVLAPTRGLPGAVASTFLGLFNESDNSNPDNHVVGIELDTILNPEFEDINDNHVGVDINSLISVVAAPAGFFPDDSTGYRNLTLISGKPMQVWIEYDGHQKQMNVTLAPVNIGYKPKTPLLSLAIDLSAIIKDTMYVGFSSATGSLVTSHYVLGWSFATNRPAQELVFSQLPKLPPRPKKISKLLTAGLPLLIILALATLVSCGVFQWMRKKRKFAEELEDWESDYGPHRFRYRDLYIATNGFKDKELLGAGGFGKVYRGVLPTSKIEIAVKKVSHGSRQGLKEFVAEIVSIGRLRHRNLVPLLGYCRRKGELLLVYDYMPNGSLDNFLYNKQESALNWDQRFRVIQGIASALLYLHEEWEQVVVHRDVKASNVLLDSEMNGRLGDFGLARLYDHGTDPHTTHIVGTLGYLAPENMRKGKATRSSDMFAFGAFLLEVVCGSRPIDLNASSESLLLVDKVFASWKAGELLQVVDSKMAQNYNSSQAELVLKLGLLCSNVHPEDRPTSRQVVQYLECVLPLPDLSSLSLSRNGLMFADRERGFSSLGFSNVMKSNPSLLMNNVSQWSSMAESLLCGR